MPFATGLHAARGLVLICTCVAHLKIQLHEARAMCQMYIVMQTCVCREAAHAHVDNSLPFELKALEAALTHAISLMEADALKLFKDIQPILEALSFKVRYLSCLSCKLTDRHSCFGQATGARKLGLITKPFAT